jgi:hypothetical protein
MTEHSYELVVPPEAPVPWDTYSRAVGELLDGLLASREVREPVYQQLIEQHPSLLPWIYGTFGGGHHGLVHGAVIAQPHLAGLSGHRPDFMMIARDTSSLYAVLVGIESPGKRWFTQKGQATEKLTQAINQIRQWKSWFAQPGNTERFLQDYEVPIDYRIERRFQQRYLLIYGRRDALANTGHTQMRSLHEQSDERFVSFDHLRPSEELRNALTVRVDGSGYEALYVPPTICLGPFEAKDHVDIRGKEAAVFNNPLMPPTRGEFLRHRWLYWDDWARKYTGIGRYVRLGDCE